MTDEKAAAFDEVNTGFDSIEEEQAAMINDLHAAIKQIQVNHETELACDRILHEGHMRQASAAHDCLTSDVSLVRINASLKSGGGATESDVFDLTKQRNAQKAAMEHAQRDAVLLHDQLISANAKIKELEETIEALDFAFPAMQSVLENLKSTSYTTLCTQNMKAEGKLTEVHRKLALQSDFLLSTTTVLHSLRKSHQHEVAKLLEMHAKTLLDVMKRSEELLDDLARLLSDIADLRKERNDLSMVVSEIAEKAVRKTALSLDADIIYPRSVVHGAINTSTKDEATATAKRQASPRAENSFDASGGAFFALPVPASNSSRCSPIRPFTSRHQLPLSASFLAREISKMPILAFQTHQRRASCCKRGEKMMGE